MSAPTDSRQAAWVTPTVPGDSSPIRDLFARLTATLGRSLAFDGAELALLEGDAVRTFPADSMAERSHYSPATWPSVAGLGALDSAYEVDQRLLEAGAHSVIAAPLGSSGVLILWSRSADAFAPSQLPLLDPITEFLSVAAERERLWTIERERERRRRKLDQILPMIMDSLDVREVFVRMSSVINEVIPHDVVGFALLTPDRGGVRVQAATHEGMMELPEYRYSNQEEAVDSNWRYLLAYDLNPVDETSVRCRITPKGAPETIEVVVSPGANWMRFITENGIHSSMRVPIRAKDRPVGGIAFMSKRTDAYDDEDGVVASRIADHVALALAHQELAEDARRMAVAEERAQSLERRVDALSRELERFSAHRAIGRSASWKKALADASQVAAADTTVLVTGESGTGKEVIARYIHRGSKRAKGPFVALNCAALPEQLLESELFGHERGAFTGAVEARAGKIEQAAGGVLFLDEVGEMTPVVQAKFLRVLQEREFQRVGGSRTIKADVRIVAATNRDPRAGISAGTFREDLYYRLSVFEIHLPPLRERPEDILVLAEAFLDEIGRSVGRPAAGLSEDAREQMLVHSWPGNVRELRNAIERAVILCQGGLVTRDHLPMTVARPVAERVAMVTGPAASSEFPVEGVDLDTVEKDLVQKAMAKAGQNKSQAAKLLGLSRGQLYSLLRKHGLTEARR